MALTSLTPAREQVRRRRPTGVGIATAILTLTVALPLYSEQPTKAGKRSAVIPSKYASQHTRVPYAHELLPELLSVAPPRQVGGGEREGFAFESRAFPGVGQHEA